MFCFSSQIRNCYSSGKCTIHVEISSQSGCGNTASLPRKENRCVCLARNEQEPITRLAVLAGRLELKCDGTRWRTGGEVKGKLANGVGSQYPSHHLGTWRIQPALVPLLQLMRTPRLPVVDWTNAPADLNGLVRSAERQNMVSARVPSHFKRSLQLTEMWSVVKLSLWSDKMHAMKMCGGVNV